MKLKDFREHCLRGERSAIYGLSLEGKGCKELLDDIDRVVADTRHVAIQWANAYCPAPEKTSAPIPEAYRRLKEQDQRITTLEGDLKKLIEWQHRVVSQTDFF
jgi:hypothetical protein